MAPLRSDGQAIVIEYLTLARESSGGGLKIRAGRAVNLTHFIDLGEAARA